MAALQRVIGLQMGGSGSGTSKGGLHGACLLCCVCFSQPTVIASSAELGVASIREPRD